MIRLRDFFQVKFERICPLPPLSLDCLEVGQRFRVRTVSIKPVLRMFLCHGISEHQGLSILSRNQYWIEVGTQEDPQSIILSLAQARQILVRRI